MTKTFSSKHPLVEAVQLTNENKDEVINWAKSHQQNIYHGWTGEPFKSAPCIIVPTDCGEEYCCHLMDWLIVDEQPENWYKIYCCSNEVFQKTYEKLT